MASHAPITRDTGVHLPVKEYTATVTDIFPRPGKLRQVESTVDGRTRVDILPVNLWSADNGLQDAFLEFRIPAITGQFLDLSTLTIDLDLTLTKPDGSLLTDDDHILFVNGLSNTLFKSCTCYLNGQMVESNVLYNYHAYIRMISGISPDSVNTLGRCCYFYPEDDGSGVVKTFTNQFFTDSKGLRSKLMRDCKAHGVSITAPLFLDITTLDQLLYDNVDVRLKFELANKTWFLNTDFDVMQVQCNIRKARLWIDRVTPHLSALQALRKAVLQKPLEYTFDHTIYKTYILPQNQTNFTCDMPWGHVVPDKLYFVIVDMSAFNGVYRENGLYLQHGDVNSINITVNGSSVHNVKCELPVKYSHLYYTCIQTLGIQTKHSLMYDTFVNGRAVFAFNLLPEEVENAIPLERSGNLRINIGLGKADNANRMILFFGDTTGVIQIDDQSAVSCKIRA